MKVSVESSRLSVYSGVLISGFVRTKMDKFDTSSSEIENPDRREVMSALLKYSAVVGAASGTVLSASQAIAQSAASGGGRVKCNNGFGNGDQCAPGNSGANNNAENAGGGGGTNPNGIPNAPGNSGTNGNNGNDGN